MAKYKNIEENVELALKLTKDTGKEHQFDLCQSEGAEIIATNIQEVGSEKCPGTRLGSFRTYPESTSPKDQPGVQKV
jgi:hypothetical protein